MNALMKYDSQAGKSIPPDPLVLVDVQKQGDAGDHQMNGTEENTFLGRMAVYKAD
jgi:hypothetical protein